MPLKGIVINMPVIIEGLAELKDALRQLPDATAKNVLRRVAATQLKPIVVLARTLAPRKSGKLANSIVVSTKLTSRQRPTNTQIGDDVEMFAGAESRHAHLIEYGSVKMRPHPFMRPAWDASKAEFFNAIYDSLWMEIAKAAERLARKKAKAAP